AGVAEGLTVGVSVIVLVGETVAVRERVANPGTGVPVTILGVQLAMAGKGVGRRMSTPQEVSKQASMRRVKAFGMVVLSKEFWICDFIFTLYRMTAAPAHQKDFRSYDFGSPFDSSA